MSGMEYRSLHSIITELHANRRWAKEVADSVEAREGSLLEALTVQCEEMFQEIDGRVNSWYRGITVYVSLGCCMEIPVDIKVKFRLRDEDKSGVGELEWHALAELKPPYAWHGYCDIGDDNSFDGGDGFLSMVATAVERLRAAEKQTNGENSE